MQFFKAKTLSIYTKNILIMFKGTFIAQVIAIIGAIYLAKLYGQTVYGYFGVFVSFSGIFSVINTLQLDNNIVTLKNKNNSNHWTSFLFLITIIISVLLICFFYLIDFFYNFDLIQKNIIVLAIISAFFLANILILERTFTFYEKFKYLSYGKIILSLTNVTFQYVLYKYFSLKGLMFGMLISQFTLIAFYFFYGPNFRKKINFKLIKRDFKNNTSIIKYLLPSNLINTLAINLMPILIFLYFDANEAAVYFLSLKILTTPLHLISSSIANVYFQKSSELFQLSNKKLLQLTKQTVKANFVFMLLFILLINTFGICFLEIIFDKSWNNLRLTTLILSFLILARSTFNPISSIIVVSKKNHVSLYFNIYLLIINLLAVYIGYLNNSIFYAIIALSFLGGIGYLLLLKYFLNLLKIKNV